VVSVVLFVVGIISHYFIHITCIPKMIGPVPQKILDRIYIRNVLKPPKSLDTVLLESVSSLPVSSDPCVTTRAT
jgi:hypothetical protein